MKKWLLFLTLAIFSCKKEQPPVADAPAPEKDAPAENHDCQPLPPPPPGFHYVDSTADPYKNVISFFYNPVAGNEVLVVVEGTVLGANQLRNVNLKTGQTKILGNLDKYLPDVNASGWIVFSDVENNIYKVKTNGDSLVKLTNNQRAHDPKWHPDGRSFFYLQDEYAGMGSKLIRAHADGTPYQSWDHSLPYSAPLQKADKLLLQKQQGNVVRVVELDLDSLTEREIFTAAYNMAEGRSELENFFVDANDQYCFWSNKHGIMRRDLHTGSTDTLFRNCETSKYMRAWRSGNENEISVANHRIRVAHKQYLVHEYYAVEHHLPTSQSRTLSIFP